MIFNTWVYAAFTLVTFIVYWFLVPRKWRAVVLLLASYIFFTYHFPFHTFLIMAMTVVVYLLSLPIFHYRPAMESIKTTRETAASIEVVDTSEILTDWSAGIKATKKLAWYQHPKLYMVISILFSVSTLVYYKYLKMAIGTLNRIFDIVDYEKVLQIPSIVVPLGISFFVFEFIHYTVDAYQGKAQKTGFFQFAVFIMYFPSLVSGPIKRYQAFNQQTLNMTAFKKEYLYEGLSRILIGIGKKTIIADQMTPYANFMLHPGTATTAQLWIAMYAYSMKIYFDFSGYTDIAIGSARLFGYKLPENFNLPYLKENIAKFWNNWHMSLSSWIRDYVYIPLGGNRGTLAFAARNSLIAMFVSGLWHGAAWHFVIWGLYHGFGMAFLRYYTAWKKQWGIKPGGRWRLAFSTIFTFHFVSIGWIFFYADFSTSIEVLKKMGGLL